jgi:hypothetical protein
MRAFRQTRRGIEGSLSDHERALLRNLATDLIVLLDDGVPAAADPVLSRFFPDAYGDDADAAEDFRSLTESDLRDAKRAAAATFVESLDGPGGTLVLDAETAEIWLLTLNDLRLAIGTRFAIEEDTLERLHAGEIEASEDALTAFEVYEVLSWLQESLIHALSG